MVASIPCGERPVLLPEDVANAPAEVIADPLS